MSFTIKQEGQGITKIVLSEAFKKRFKDRYSVQRYTGKLDLRLLCNKIDELRSRIIEKENNGGALVHINDKALSFIYYLSEKGIKTAEEANIYPESIERLSNLDTAFRVFQNLFGIIEQLDELKIKKELNKQMRSIKSSLKASYIGYIAKNVDKSESCIISDNHKRLKSINKNLDNLQKLYEKNVNNYDLLVLILVRSQYNIHRILF